MSLSVAVIETSELGDRSYVAHDGEVAVVVDPQRDLDRVEELVADLGVRVAMVVETHIHNDYVTGGFELARRTGAGYLVAAADQVEFDRDAVSDGDERTVGTMSVRVVATPGHTDTHLSYIVRSDDDTQAVFTGGSLLFGSVGRTDLVDPDRTEELTRAQYHSARRLAELLADDAAVYPTHGFGSFCSSGSSAGGDASTIGQERARNDALVEPDEDAFVAKLDRRPDRLPELLRPHGCTQPAGSRRSRPVGPAAGGSVTSCEPGSRPASGSWTCAIAPPTPRSTSAARSASRWAPSSPPIWAG